VENEQRDAEKEWYWGWLLSRQAFLRAFGVGILS
jgi:hypothetical protein